MNYGQFLNMFPEVYLTGILLLVFFWDVITCKTNAEDDRPSHRELFNPLVVLLMTAYVVALFFTSSSDAFGGMYISTEAIHVMKIILGVGTVIVLIQSRKWITESLVNGQNGHKEGEFYMLVISTLLGMNMMMSAGHFLMFFLGLEMASVPMACLVAFDRRQKSAEGAAKYILVATFSSGIMLFGISFIYAACGTLYFTDVAELVSIKPLSIMGLVFFFSGLGFKISLVPFHFWTADTYEGAPTTVTGYLSVISKGAAAFTLCTILMKVFQPMVEYWEMMLYIVIVLSITIANLFAIRQSDLKRFMAFSSISQAGYIMLAVVGNNALGVTALMYYTLIYVVANLAVFTVIAAVEERNSGRTDMDAYNGFYRTNPRLSFLMTLALFSLAGIPPFAGMFSKFFVFMAAAEQGSFGAYFVVFVALINTVVSLYYYLLIVKAMYIKGADNPLPTFMSDLNTKLALALCTAGIVLFGVCSFIYDWLFVAV